MHEKADIWGFGKSDGGRCGYWACGGCLCCRRAINAAILRLPKQGHCLAVDMEGLEVREP